MRRISPLVVALVVVVACSESTVTSQPPPAPPPTSHTSPSVLPFPDQPAPPMLEISEPSEGASFSESSIRFSGRTDPGCTVTVDGNQAAVDKAGGWAAELSFDPGVHTATVVAIDQTGTIAERKVSFTVEEAALGYYRFDETGLYRVFDSQTTTLVEGPVVWAADDLLGGVLYARPEQPVEWLRAGATDPVVFHHGGLIGVLDGLAVMLVTQYDPEQCPEHDFYWATMVVAIDLASGTRNLLFCDRDGPDGGVFFESMRDGLIVGVGWESWGPDTHHALYFFDASGEPVEVPNNPFPTSCAPCQLSARLSPDGSLLAYRHRPDAYWPEEVAAAMTWERWFEKTKSIPGEVAVIDLPGGSELFRTDVGAGTELLDFDGQRVVVWNEKTEESTVYDIAGGEATNVAGRVVLMQRPLQTAAAEPFLLVTSPVPGTTSMERAVRFEGITDPGTRVVAAGRYAVDVDAAGNWSVVLMLEPGTNLATFTATAASGATAAAQVRVVYRSSIQLEGAGLGVASFGDPVEAAMDALIGVLGPPTEDLVQLGPFDGLVDGYQAEDYFRTVVWADHGLRVIFSDGGYFSESGAHLAGWSVELAERATLSTPAGLGIGTTVTEAEAMYPDTFVAGPLDVCIDSDFYLGTDVGHGISDLILGWLDGPVTHPSARVIRLAAGAWPAC